MLLSRENKFIRMLESPAKLCQTWIISQTILFDRVFCSMSTSCTIQSGHPAPIVRWINHQIHWIKMNLFRRSIIQISAYFQFSMCCWTQTIWCYWQWKSLCAHILNLTQLLPTKIFTDFVVNAVILNDVSFSNMKLCLNQIDFFARVEMKCFIFFENVCTICDTQAILLIHFRDFFNWIESNRNNHYEREYDCSYLSGKSIDLRNLFKTNPIKPT